MFTPNQISQLMEIIRSQHILFIATQIGPEMLSDSEVNLLSEIGFDIDQIGITPFEEIFRWGLLSMSLNNKKSKELKYSNFKDFLKSEKYLPLTPVEKSAIQVAQRQASSDIRGLGNKISQQTGQLLIEADQQQRLNYEKIITQETVDNIKNRGSISNLVSNLGHKTGDWARDFGRISDYVMHQAFEEGRAAYLLNNYGSEAQVYKKVFTSACKKCVSLYLTDGTDSKPKVFKLTDLINNGTNIGRKVDEWKPVVGPTHPWSLLDCNTLILTDNGWRKIKDIEIGDYVLTHNKRFKKVISTIKDYQVPKDYPIKNYYSLQYYTSIKGNKKQLRKMSLTAEHKILTQKGWTEIKDVDKNNDKIFLLKTKCKNINCKNLVEVYGKTNKCCSKKCQKEYSAELASNIWKREDSEEIKDKISKTVKNKWRDTNAYSNTLLNLKSEETIKNSKERMLNSGAIKALKAGCMPTSKIQIKLFNRVKKYFKNAELEYEFNNRLLDIAIPEYKINIEFDGPTHLLPERIENDILRDKMLKDNGWHVIRYTKFPKVEELLSDIKIITDNHDGEYYLEQIDIFNITQHKLNNKHTLWDIGVEDDESFIAKGIAIHNCRCMLVYVDPNYEWSEEDGDFTQPKNYQRQVQRKSRVTVTIGDKIVNV